MATKDGSDRAAKCGMIWRFIDEGSGKLIDERPCYSWRCPVCGEKRKAEATAMLRMRLEGWLTDPDAAPNFVTLTCDPKQLPGFVIQGTDEEDGYLRSCFTRVMRQINQEERRHGAPRVQYVGVVERGGRSQNWHLHLVTDREIHVTRWRRVAVAHGLGKVVDAKRLDGARGTAVYLAKYLHKGQKRTGRKRRVLLHTRGCMPSLALWRWRQGVRRAYASAITWTPERLKLHREHMMVDKEDRRRRMEANATGPLLLQAKARQPSGVDRIVVSRRIERKFASPVRKPQVGRSSRRNREGPSDDAQGLLVPGS